MGISRGTPLFSFFACPVKMFHLLCAIRHTGAFAQGDKTGRAGRPTSLFPRSHPPVSSPEAEASGGTFPFLRIFCFPYSILPVARYSLQRALRGAHDAPRTQKEKPSKIPQKSPGRIRRGFSHHGVEPLCL